MTRKVPLPISKNNQIVIAQIISVLCGLDKPHYPFYREIRLYELQVWARLSDLGGQMPKQAGCLLGAMFLDRLGKQTKGSTRWTNKGLSELLRTAEYGALFQSCIARTGGWSGLLNLPTMHDFHNTVRGRQEFLETAIEVIDYRYRCLEENPSDKAFANLNHALTYVLHNNKGERALTQSNLRSRWNALRNSAVLIYVSDRTSFDFLPIELGTANFLSALSKKARNKSAFKTYFGQCAYVAERLGMTNLVSSFPPAEQLPRIKLPVQPLDPEVKKKFKRQYPDLYMVSSARPPMGETQFPTDCANA